MKRPLTTAPEEPGEHNAGAITLPWWRRHAWIAALFIVCYLAMGVAGTHPVLGVPSVSEFIGAIAGQAMVVWLVFSVVVIRKRKKWSLLLSFVCIFASIYLGNAVGMNEYNRESQVQQAELDVLSIKLLDAMEASIYSGAPIEVPESSAPRATGVNGEIERIMKNMLLESTQIRNDYIDELLATGLETIATPSRLEEDRDLSETRAILASARQAIDHWEEKTLELMKSTKDEIVALDMNQHKKKMFVAAIDDGMASNRANLKESIALELEIFNTTESYMQFLDENRADWIDDGGKFKFLSESARDAAFTHIEANRSAMIRQMEFQAAGVKRLVSRFPLSRPRVPHELVQTAP